MPNHFLQCLVNLVKAGKTKEFKEECLAATPEFIKGMRLYSGYTLLMTCANERGYEEAKFLVNEIGVDVNEQAKNGETALIRATHFNDLKMVELLIDLGASLELR